MADDCQVKPCLERNVPVTADVKPEATHGLCFCLRPTNTSTAARILLEHPQVDANIRPNDGATVILAACREGRVWFLKRHFRKGHIKEPLTSGNAHRVAADPKILCTVAIELKTRDICGWSAERSISPETPDIISSPIKDVFI